MNANITFPKLSQAEDFAKAWSRHTLTGHTIGSGTENVKVTLHDVTDEQREWIDDYISKVNQQ